MALKGLVHKVFGAPPGVVSKVPKPGVPEAAAPVSDIAFPKEDLGPLERAQPPAVDIDDEKLEEIVATVKNEIQAEADVVVADDPSPEPVTDEISEEIRDETAPAELADNPVEPVAEMAADTGEVIIDDTDAVAPDDLLETAEADADSAAESGDAPDEGEDGDGEDKEEGGGDLFSTLFSGVVEEEEDDYLSRLIATIPEITAQDLLDQAEDLKALMHDLG
jgi:hypothetical protein